MFLWFEFLILFSPINYTGICGHQIQDKVEERTRRKRAKEKGKSRGTSLYHHKGYKDLNSPLKVVTFLPIMHLPYGILFAKSVIWFLRLLVMRTFLNSLEGMYILILWIMTKFVVFVSRNRHLSTFSRYSLRFWCHWIWLGLDELSLLNIGLFGIWSYICLLI